MATFKQDFSFYLDKDKYSATTSDKLLDKLMMAVENSRGSVRGVTVNRDTHSIQLASTNLDALHPLAKMSQEVIEEMKLPRYKFKLVKTCALNVKFDKNTKELNLTSENTERFANFNEVSYQLSCESSYGDSMFFHSSALEDYTKDAVVSGGFVLALVKYNETITTLQNGIENTTMFEDVIHVCYNRETEKIEDVQFAVMNAGKDLPVGDFISAFNAGRPLNFIEESSAGSNTVIRSFSDFMIKITSFKLTNEEEFLKFRAFVPAPVLHSFLSDENGAYVSIS